MYTSCADECPLETARLVQVQRLLGERVGRDIFFYSISIDPKRDTPIVLKAYAEKFGVGPGWLFLTGKAEDVKLIVGEPLAVQEQDHPLLPVEPPLLQRGEMPDAGSHEAARDRRAAQPKRLRHCLRTGGVVPTGDPAQHPPEQPLVQRPRLVGGAS